MDIAADYDIDLFVAPKEAHQWVLAKVKRWENAQSPSLSRRALSRLRQQPSLQAPGDQVLNLVGERGIGKTWLLKNLANHDRRTSPVAVYLDLEQRREFSAVEDYITAIEHQVRSRCGNGAAILLLDSVPAQLDEYLRALEDAILRPHLAKRSSLVIMALVHPSHVCWRAPALRGGESRALHTFEESQTQDQVRRLAKTGASVGGSQVTGLQHSGGLPLLNYLLATHGRTEAFRLLLNHWFSRIPAEDAERVRNYLEAVCVLDVLEHASIQRVLDVYYHYNPNPADYPAHAGGVRNVLRKYWLARPSVDSPGRLVLVDSVRWAAMQVLEARDAELYAILNEAAHVEARGRK
jgi:hypothetical protein